MRVLLIDDHPLILSALQTVIQGFGDDVEVTGAGSATAARDILAAQADFDLVLLDLHLGDASGFDVLREFRESYPSLPVVVVSASDRASDVIQSIDEGAMGFIPKRSSNELLQRALRLVMDGGIYVPPMALSSDGGAVRDGGQEGPLQQAQRAAEASPYQSNPALASLALTPRQTEVLHLLLQGKPNKVIGRDLGVSVETVKDHVAAVLKALGVTSRTQAVLAVGQMVANGQAEGLQALRQPAQLGA